MMRFLRRQEPAAALPPVLKRMRELEIHTARLIRAGFAGQYHAAFHGRGIEFAQVREYQPGDDIRTIDWNVTARTAVPHVKQFVEERDLGVVVAIDVSQSMHFGSIDRRKSDLALELAAILSFAAMENNDRVGLLLFSNAAHHYIPPRRGRAHVQAMMKKAILEARQTRGAASFDIAAEFLRRVLVKRTVIVVISDFLDARFEKPLHQLNARHDVIGLVMLDPREERFPNQGLVSMVDSENGRRALVDLRGNRVAANAMLRERFLSDTFRRIDVDALPISTAVPYERDLLQFFERRVKRPR